MLGNGPSLIFFLASSERRSREADTLGPQPLHCPGCVLRLVALTRGQSRRVLRGIFLASSFLVLLGDAMPCLPHGEDP
jgi:hypothetical protein